MATEKQNTAVRKEQIIEAALHILSDNEVKKLKVTDIAKHMGLAPSALYRHFKNRDAIMSAVLEHIRIGLYLNLENAKQKTDDALERLKDLLFKHIRLIGYRQGIPRIIFSDELWGQKKERRQKMYRIVSGYLSEIEDIVREGQDKGQIRKSLDPQVVSKMFFGIVQPAALLWHMSEGHYDLDAHVAGAWPVFMELLLGK
jgi:AcrR family transcriptional regulator